MKYPSGACKSLYLSNANPTDVLVFPDQETLAHTLADALEQQICASVVARGACRLVFPGGRSPRRVFELLRERNMPWQALHFYPSDERCVPVGDPQRNDRIIEEVFLREVPLPLENLHSIPAELGPEDGAAWFSQLLLRTPPFDIVLLGVGPDGHTASLFPESPALRDDRAAVPVFNAPKPPSERVSIGMRRLRDASERLVIVTGNEKKVLIARLESGEKFPVTQVHPTKWFVEKSLVSGAQGE